MILHIFFQNPLMGQNLDSCLMEAQAGISGE